MWDAISTKLKPAASESSRNPAPKVADIFAEPTTPASPPTPPAAPARHPIKDISPVQSLADIEVSDDEAIDDGMMDDELDAFDRLMFTDMMIPLTWPLGPGDKVGPGPRPRYAPERIGPKDPMTQIIPEDALPAIAELRAVLMAQREARPGLVEDSEYPIPRWYNGAITFRSMRMRYAISMTSRGEMWAVVRRIPSNIPRIEDLGLDPKAAQILKELGREKSGLVLIAGQTGAGKTTTLTATMAGGLRSHGKKAYTIEDPCEYLLQGEHGPGFCLQNEAEDNGGWINSIKTALRSTPDYIMIGEIRDTPVALAAIRAATSGHLVFTTIHAGSVADGLDAIVRLAGGSDSEAVRQQIGQQLIAVIWQDRTAGRITMHILDCRDTSISKQVRDLVGKNKTMALSENDWTQKFAARSAVAA